MKVRELIEALQQIKNKELQVCCDVNGNASYIVQSIEYDKYLAWLTISFDTSEDETLAAAFRQQMQPAKQVECDDSVTESDEGELDDIFTLKEFTECVRDGLFIDDDGFGELATYIDSNSNQTNVANKAITKSGIKIYPSDVDIKHQDGGINPNYSHVVWYNK